MEKDDIKNLGYIEYGGTSYIYYFNPENFRLTLIPKSVDEQRESYLEVFKSIGTEPDRGNWIKSNIVVGNTLGKNSGIVFSILDNPSTYNGIAQYPINWYAELPADVDMDSVDGIEVIGGEVNRFYSPNHALERELKEDTYSVKTSRQEDVDCGSFTIENGIVCSVSVSAYGSLNFSSYDAPVYATSRLKLEFSSPLSIEKAERIYYGDVLSLFQYLNYRRNIAFGKVRLFWKKPIEGYPNNHSYGEIHFPPKNFEPDNLKKQEKTIGYDLIENRTGELLSWFHQGKASLEYITDTASKRNSYPPSRMIAILAEFEREFRNVYGTDALRHEEYKQTKDEVASWLEEKANEATGKIKQYIKSFSKTISNLDDSYGQRVKHAIEDKEGIIKPFIDATYTGGLSEMKEEIPDRLNSLRNGFMHSRLDLELEPVNISDINILEILNYIIVLQQFIEPVKVMRAVNELFGFHIDIPKTKVADGPAEK